MVSLEHAWQASNHDLGPSDLEGQGMAGRKETKNITKRKNEEGGNILAEKRKPNAW